MNQKTSFYNDTSIKLVNKNDWDNSKSLVFLLKSELSKLLNINTIEILKPIDSKLGNYSTNIAMIISKNEGNNPYDKAIEMVNLIKNNENIMSVFNRVEAVKPGFINFYLNNSYLLNQLIESLNDDYSKSEILKNKNILFEYAHPNPFKAFHIGHLRNIILGESLIRILESVGANVIRANYQGDVGMHIAKCLWSFRKIDRGSFPTNTNDRVKLLANCYIEGAKAFENENYKEEIKDINKLIYTKEDENINNLWETGKKWSLDKFHEIYNRVYSKFDREFFESETLIICKELIEEALNKNILEKSDGAIVFKGEKYGLDTRVYLNSRGLPTYEGKELGLAQMQFSEYSEIDLCIHNVAVEQISFFKSTFKVQSLLNPDKFEGKQYHNAYEFVGLKSGKMSSRTGNVVLAEDILNEANNLIKDIIKEKNKLDNNIDETSEIISIGAIKYSFLNINPKSYLAFDINKSINFEGNSGPYIQYTYARSNKIIEGVDINNTNVNDLISKYENINIEERLLLEYISEFPDIVIDSAKTLSPNLICNYLFNISQAYNTFYKKHQILKSEEPIRTFRIIISLSVNKIIKRGLELLGIKTIEKM